MPSGTEVRSRGGFFRPRIVVFPADFAFRLTRDEVVALRLSRSQIVILKRGGNLKYAPLAFTEHGPIMAASVLNSSQAVQMSVFVVRAFVRLRGLVVSQTSLVEKLAELECRVVGHDDELRAIVETIRQLLQPPTPSRRRIGFRTPPLTGAVLQGERPGYSAPPPRRRCHQPRRPVAGPRRGGLTTPANVFIQAKNLYYGGDDLSTWAIARGPGFFLKPDD